jgi:hypothetical protein
MQILLGIVEQGIGLLGLIISLLIDGDLALGYLHGSLHQIDFEKIIRLASLFLVALFVCKAIIWIT